MSHITEHIVDTHGGIDHWEDRGVLVRCKDCVFMKLIGPIEPNCDVSIACTYQPGEPSVRPKDFCSHGRLR